MHHADTPYLGQRTSQEYYYWLGRKGQQGHSPIHHYELLGRLWTLCSFLNTVVAVSYIDVFALPRTVGSTSGGSDKRSMANEAVYQDARVFELLGLKTCISQNRVDTCTV